jgi:transcriptional regulator with XRE-family HTH domain
MTQKQLSELTGLSLRTVQRIELGEVDNPPLRYLVNLAMALDIELEAVIEDEWLEWMVFDARAAEPPASLHWMPKRARPGD